ncbi:MAG: pilin [Candidatus Paceibacterota bacterium]
MSHRFTTLLASTALLGCLLVLAPHAQAKSPPCDIGEYLSLDGTTCETPGGTTQGSTPAPAPQKAACPAGTYRSLGGTKCETPPNKSSVDSPAGRNAGGGTAETSDGSEGAITQTPRGINFAYIGRYFNDFMFIINDLLVPVLISIAFIFFLFGVYKYFIMGAESDSELETGRKFVLWGIIGFVVIVSVWGLVWIVLVTFNLAPGGTAPLPPTL